MIERAADAVSAVRGTSAGSSVGASAAGRQAHAGGPGDDPRPPSLAPLSNAAADPRPASTSAEAWPADAAVELPPGDPETTARIICLRLLERRARSRAELADALRRRGVPEQPAARVLDRFGEVGLIDDSALAETIAGAQHRERGLARRAVAARLRKRGFDDEVVDAALDTIDPAGERERARAVVAKRQRTLAGLPIEIQARRLVGLLARKGYSAGLAYDVVRAQLAQPDEALGSSGPVSP